MALFDKLQLAHPKVRAMWRLPSWSTTKLRIALLQTTDYPAILKVGHIHQQKSTVFLPSKTKVVAKADEFVQWTDKLMHTSFHDDNPLWSSITNQLYEQIEPCAFVQVSTFIRIGDFSRLSPPSHSSGRTWSIRQTSHLTLQPRTRGR